MSDRVPLSVPFLGGSEWAYVKECLDTGWVSSAGRYVEKFEAAFAATTGARHGVACVNGTAALQVALIAAGVERGDEVVVPTVTFIAPVNAVRYLGAEPVFMDCDAYYNMDAAKTLDFLRRETVFKSGVTFNKATGRRIAALLPVHVFGNAVDLFELAGECRERGIRLIEDASESLGTRYTQEYFSGRHTGTIGDIGCFSFNGNKIITTGGGGMIVTDNDHSAARARYLTTQAKDDPVRYVHNEVGYNFRLTNLQAALGVAQLEQLEAFLMLKQNHYKAFKKEIDAIPGLRLAEPPPYADCNLWLYALQIQKDIYGKDREELLAYLSGKGIETRPVWYLNHLQKPYGRCQAYKIENALNLLECTLNIPSSVGLTDSQITRVLESLKNA
jgi:aminotransferase in exopolysaccharide biosynthesis